MEEGLFSDILFDRRRSLFRIIPAGGGVIITLEGDYIFRALTDDKTVRVFLARTTDLVEEARRRHRTTPTATAALGRVLTAAVMMATDLKGQETVTIRVDGGGPLGTIVAVAEAEGTVRGYVSNPEAEVPVKYPGKLDVGTAVGLDGYIEVAKDLGLKTPFSGRVPLVSGEIAEDLAYYFTYSEQVPSLVALGVYIERDYTVKAAGGLIVQALPGATEDVLSRIEKQVKDLGPVTSLLLEEPDLEVLLEQVLSGISYHVVERRPLSFLCKCSLDKVKSVVAGLAGEDIEAALKDRGYLEVVCNFCNETYRFDAEQVALIRSGSS